MSRASILQPSLFGDDPRLPEGFEHRSEVLDRHAEATLAARIAELPFRPFEFHGWLGARRVVSFGWRYDYDREALAPAEPPPAFLLDLREVVGRFGRDPGAFRQVLVTEYAPGAGIGWHRDKPQFDEVVGVSLLAPCVFRFRKRRAAGGWERASLPLPPRSAYLISGEARAAWEHSIPPLQALRYSVTFRSPRG